MHKIRPNLWLGGDYATTNTLGYEELKANGITAVLNVAAEVNDTCTSSNSHTPLMCCKIGLHEDSVSNKPQDICAAVVLLKSLLDAGHVAYVHCHAGANRSPYVMALHLATEERKAFDDVLADIRRIRPIMFPNNMYEWYGIPMALSFPFIFRKENP